ncbi:MAG: hypothetical protein J0M12_05945 [Deltaproteobacteria bacterium]|nr:hypothetical protein [Deltaproteobacteria bacterium]
MTDRKIEKGKESSSTLVTDMVAGNGQKKTQSAELVVEPEAAPAEVDSFARELERTLRETEQAVLGLEGKQKESAEAKSWQQARSIVETFKPVPLFIWRLSNFVLGKPGSINKASEGLVFGLRRLLFAAASDSVLGAGRKVNSVHDALEILAPDVVAATAVIHAISRRLATRQFERIWRPILDDAILRSQIGFFVGGQDPSFGAGRGMLAGFAGRSGLAVLIASGDLEQARKALEMLATGAEIKNVGMALYGCDPIQISAMMLSASGCGRDAAYGTVSYSSAHSIELQAGADEAGKSQAAWHSAFLITEYVRTARLDKVPPEIWARLNFTDTVSKNNLADRAKNALRRGHGWNWLSASS